MVTYRTTGMRNQWGEGYFSYSGRRGKCWLLDSGEAYLFTRQIYKEAVNGYNSQYVLCLCCVIPSRLIKY